MVNGHEFSFKVLPSGSYNFFQRSSHLRKHSLFSAFRMTNCCLVTFGQQLKVVKFYCSTTTYEVTAQGSILFVQTLYFGVENKFAKTVDVAFWRYGHHFVITIPNFKLIQISIKRPYKSPNTKSYKLENHFERAVFGLISAVFYDYQALSSFTTEIF